MLRENNPRTDQWDEDIKPPDWKELISCLIWGGIFMVKPAFYQQNGRRPYDGTFNSNNLIDQMGSTTSPPLLILPYPPPERYFSQGGGNNFLAPNWEKCGPNSNSKGPAAVVTEATTKQQKPKPQFLLEPKAIPRLISRNTTHLPT